MDDLSEELERELSLRSSRQSPKHLTVYSHIEGLAPLRNQVASFHGVDSSAVVITNGASEGLWLVLSCLLKPRVRVLLPQPTFPPYTALVRFNGGIPRFYDANDSPNAILKQLERSPEVQVVVVNSPHNPTGCVLSAEFLAELAQQCDARGIWLLSDEVYGAFLYNGLPSASLVARFNTSVHSRQIVFGSMSKTMGLPAVRVGYAVIPHSALFRSVIGLKLHTGIHTSVVAQDLISANYPRIMRSYVPKRVSILTENRKMLLAALSTKPWKISTGDGGYYVMVHSSSNDRDDLSFWRRFGECGIGSIPARAYGVRTSAVRLSFSVKREVIGAACRIIREMSA